MGVARMSTRYLTGPQVQERLSIPPSTLSGLIRRKHDPLPALQLGRRNYRFPLIELEKWESRNSNGGTAA